MTDLAAGMGYSIYFMLVMVALLIGAIVFVIVRGERKRGTPE